MRRDLINCVRAILVFTVVLGLAYPLATTGVAQVLWPNKSDGSVIKRDGKVVGSRLIGQDFKGRPGYFQSRPSVTGYNPAGTARQFAAILASGSRSEALAGLDIPTLVIHGTADNLVQPSGGDRTAEVIPDAKLLVVDGMGHDLAPPLWPQIIGALVDHAGTHA